MMDRYHNYLGIYSILLALLLTLALSLSAGCSSDEGLDALTSGALPTTSVVEPPTTLAGSDAITVISSEVEIDFPHSLTFFLEAESIGEINDVELRYKIDKVTTASVLATVTPEFSPGHQVKVQWRWDTRKADLPPGATIRYYWVIETDTETRLQTEQIAFSFNDLRYDWNELDEGMVRLFWYKGDDDFGEQLMAASQAALMKLAEDTGVQLENTASIYIYDGSDDLQEALIYAQEWTGGMAFTEYGIIAIGISPGDLDWGKRTVAHELTHLVVAQATANPYIDLPTWVDEGLAMYIEGDLTAGFREALSNAISNDSLFSVDSLSSTFPADPYQAQLAYAQSYSLVRFLIDEYGRDKMLELLQVFKDGNTQSDALMAVYGFDTDGLGLLWRTSLGI